MPPPPTGRIVIAGGSGFVGTSLAAWLVDRGCDVAVLSRSAAPRERAWQTAQWDARTVGPWREVLDGAAGLVNLVGRSVDCIKTPGHCDEILRSRVEATRALGLAVKDLTRPPPAWVQMSTAHIYGDPPEVICDEDSTFGYGLAPTVGKAWEAAFREHLPPAMRGVVLRTSFVIGPGGGALAKLVRLARWGLGGQVGRGRQGMSWLHDRDMNRIFERALFDQQMKGVYVATAPRPVSNREFMRALRRAVGRPIGLPAPAFLVRLGARFVLRTDPELATEGRYCVPTRLLAEGFEFEFTDVEEALQDLLRGRTRASVGRRPYGAP